MTRQDDWVRVCAEDFQVDSLYQTLAVGDSGAVVVFVGRVRDLHQQDDKQSQVVAIELEHYPGMAEQQIQAIITAARQRWVLHRCIVVHRVGYLKAAEQIVFVGVSSRHRQDAFQAAEFIMDFLKSEAPFWKKEHRSDGDHWIAAAEKDEAALLRWKSSEQSSE